MKVFIYNHGDPSVGIPGHYTELDLDRDEIDDNERGWVKDELWRMFVDLWGFDDVQVVFDDEPEAEIFLTDEFVA